MTQKATERPCVVLPHHPVMTVREVAKACGVAPRTVYKWFDSKRVDGYRIPGSQDPRIKTESLAEWLASNGYLVVSEEPTLADRLREYASLDKHNRYLVEALYEAADELERRKEIIRNWAYCTDIGMRKECPEKVNELADALISVGVAPYSIRR